MASRADLLRRLAEVADDLGPLAAPAPWREQLTALCDTARLALGAAAVSVARLDATGDVALVYVASVGPGADAIIDTRLPQGRGLAWFAVASGQALAIDEVRDDPRFERRVAEATGYVPTSMLVVPVVDDAGNPLGVLSVLDRGTEGGTSADALRVAAAFAAQAALVLPGIDLVVGLGPLLIDAVADTVAANDTDLAAGLRRVAARLPTGDGELVATAALLAELRTRPADTRASVERVLAELLALTEPRRRR